MTEFLSRSCCRGVGSVSSRKARVIILCEGIDDYDFARRALIRLGWNRRFFEFRMTSAGAGDQFVRENYAAEVRTQRARDRRKLLVCTDADKLTVSQRAQTLAQALKATGQAARRPRGEVAHWIPRRNLETWIFLYSKGTVAENVDYKGKVDQANLNEAAQGWGSDLARRSVTPRRCASLQTALLETDRIRS
jgi:hypothetical protein